MSQRAQDSATTPGTCQNSTGAALSAEPDCRTLARQSIKKRATRPPFTLQLSFLILSRLYIILENMKWSFAVLAVATAVVASPVLERASSCPGDYNPIHCSNGVTYNNACEMEASFTGCLRTS